MIKFEKCERNSQNANTRNANTIRKMRTQEALYTKVIKKFGNFWVK